MCAEHTALPLPAVAILYLRGGCFVCKIVVSFQRVLNAQQLFALEALAVCWVNSRPSHLQSWQRLRAKNQSLPRRPHPPLSQCLVCMQMELFRLPDPTRDLLFQYSLPASHGDFWRWFQEFWIQAFLICIIFLFFPVFLSSICLWRLGKK